MSSSFSITPPSFKYDVFVSFRGEDTHKGGFINYLHRALAVKGLDVCLDQELYTGDDIWRPFIKESRTSVVIFSKYYASSIWCLNELVHIQECKNVYDQIVIPVFYDIDPSDVGKQTGSFGDAFKKHEYRYEDRILQRWRNALTEISNLDGFDNRIINSESLLIEEIVKDILKKLYNMSTSRLENAHFIDIKEEDRGDEDNRVTHKITAEQMFVATNFILEVPSVVFDQLSSLHKPQYALLIMLMSFTTMLICIIELVYKGGEGRVGWRWREKIPWFYYPTPSLRPFGTVTDFIGLLCAIFQCIFAAVDYAFYLQNINNPIKLSIWPFIFAFCLLCSNLLKNPHRKTL